MKKTLYNKAPRTQNFTYYLKYTNKTTQEDLLRMELEVSQIKFQHMLINKLDIESPGYLVI